jgi:hypothetical protein
MALMYPILRGERFSAGAEWLASNGGREVEYKFADLGGSDRLLFDLTYNGILHSVIAGGAKTNPLLHRTLKLPYPESARGTNGEHPDPDD